MDKKGTTESYSFLIGVVIMIFILAAIASCVYQQYSDTPMEDCIDEIVKANQNVVVGQHRTVVCDFRSGSMLIGFDREDNSTAIYGSNVATELKAAGFIDKYVKPSTCGVDGACLCACKNTNKKGDLTYCVGDVYCKNLVQKDVYGANQLNNNFPTVSKSTNSFIISGQDDPLPLVITPTKEAAEICVGAPCNFNLNTKEHQEFFTYFTDSWQTCGAASKERCYCEHSLPSNISVLEEGRGFMLPLIYTENNLTVYSANGYPTTLIRNYRDFTNTLLTNNINIYNSKQVEDEFCLFTYDGIRNISALQFLYDENTVYDGKFYFVKDGERVCLAKEDDGFGWLEGYTDSCTPDDEISENPKDVKIPTGRFKPLF